MANAFDEWLYAQEGFSIRAERFDGDVDWLKAAYETGRSQAYEECAKIADKQAETEELYMQGTDKEREEYKFAAKMFRFIAKSIRQHSQKGRDND